MHTYTHTSVAHTYTYYRHFVRIFDFPNYVVNVCMCVCVIAPTVTLQPTTNMPSTFPTSTPSTFAPTSYLPSTAPPTTTAIIGSGHTIYSKSIILTIGLVVVVTVYMLKD